MSIQQPFFRCCKLQSLLWGLLFLANNSLWAQTDSTQYILSVLDIDAKHLAWPLIKDGLDTFNINNTKIKLRELSNKLQEAGYLQASFPRNPQCDSFFCRFSLKVGPLFEWTALQNGNLPPELLKALGFGDVLLRNKVFYYKDLAKIQSKVLIQCENNGYPFAYTWLDSIRADTSGAIAARIYLDYGPAISIDSLQVIGKTIDGTIQKVRISKRYLSSYLGLKKGMTYNEEQIRKIKKRLRELPFLSTYKDPQILFQGEKAFPLLFLETRRASKFDVLFGLLPNTNPSTQQQQFNFTGNVNIDLINSLGRGERLSAQWQQFQRGRSELRMGFALPYLFRTPLGIDAKFELYRRDSTYIDIIGDIGISYIFDGNNFLKIYWRNTSTNVQNPNTALVLLSRKLPNILDLRNNSFGAEYYFQRLDYRWNPLKGFELRAGAAVGAKYIKPNNNILSLTDPLQPDFDFGTLYDSISMRSFQYSGYFSYAHFFQLWKQLTLMGRYKTAAVFNNRNLLYTNELLRIGGQQVMRGFDEQSIFASWYQVATAELRYLLGSNSYTYIFGDFSYTENSSEALNPKIWRYGFGVGVALETKVGIFGLSYALGSSFDSPLLFRNGKIHFGYVNIF